MIGKQEAGSRKQEAGSRKQEAGSRKQEAGSRQKQSHRIAPLASIGATMAGYTINPIDAREPKLRDYRY